MLITSTIQDQQTIDLLQQAMSAAQIEPVISTNTYSPFRFTLDGISFHPDSYVMKIG